MNLKQRFSIIFSALFSIVLALVMIILFSLFEQFRHEEFKQRLQEKSENAIKLLIDVEEIDERLLKLIEKKTVNKLYKEKIIVFDDSLRLVYSSLDEFEISLNKEDLFALKKNKVLFKRIGNDEIYGEYYSSPKNNFYVLVKAEDKYGFRKLQYLKYLLIGSFLISNIIVWALSFYLSKISLGPLDIVTNKIKEISEKNLNVRLIESKNRDEIYALTNSFNQMIDRIEKSYKKQKEFTSNASHELRTPITRIVSQLENIIFDKDLNPKLKNALISISEDSYQLSELVSSLLLLSQLEETDKTKFIKSNRLDELIFSSSSVVTKSYPDYKLIFDIQNNSSKEINLELKSDESLLKIAFINLLKNAYVYSNDNTVYCNIEQFDDCIIISILNKGIVPNINDIDELFQPFFRGSNSVNKSGSGLGLSITKRIIQYHNGNIAFERPDKNTNSLKVTFTTLT